MNIFSKINLKYLALIVIVILSLIPSLGHIAKNMHSKFTSQNVETITAEENRYLNNFPAYSGQFTDYTRSLDEYFNDRFAARNLAIKAERKLRGFWEDSGRSVYRGQEGWLFWSEALIWDSYQGRSNFTLQTRKGFENFIEQIKSRSLASGAGFAATIVPNKSTIYPEYAPKRFGEKSPRNFLGYVMASSDKDALHLVDIKLLLIAQKNTGKLYHKTDTHWTSQGAFIAYQALMTTLTNNGGEFERLQGNDLVSREITDFQGDLGRMIETDIVEIDKRLSPKNLALFDVETLNEAASADIFRTTIYKRKGALKYNGRKIVIIGDSFSLRYVDFFKTNFDMIITMHHKFGDIDIDAVFNHQPDVVIVSPVERYSELIADKYKP